MMTSGVRRPSSPWHGFLDLEVAAFEHSRGLEHAPQLQLAPLAADVRRAQRPREPAGFRLQRELRVRQRAQLLGERGVRRRAIAIDVLQLGVDFRQRLAQRLHQLVDRLAPARRDRPRPRSGTRRAFPSRDRGSAVVLRERVGGDRGESVLQRVARVLEQRRASRRRCAARPRDEAPARLAPAARRPARCGPRRARLRCPTRARRRSAARRSAAIVHAIAAAVAAANNASRMSEMDTRYEV